MEKSICLITINATKYGYSDEENNIDNILINRDYFPFKWNKDIFEDLKKLDNNNLKCKDEYHFTSMLTYCGIIPEGQIVIVICGNITEYIANKIEEIITIYSYDSDEEQCFAKTFLKNDSYRYLCTFLNKMHKVPKENYRICKYCGKDKENTSFKNDSHIIPKSLGNNKYIDAEECDNCNQKFSSEIENDSTRFFNLLLKNNQIVKSNINMNNLYRIFVKITLGFIPYCNLSNFCDTICWLNNTNKNDKLPEIIVSKNDNGNFEHPEITIYNRKIDDYNIPYMYSELYINNFLFTYIIPFSKSDKIDFTDNSVFNNFIKNTNIIKFTKPNNNLKYIKLCCNETDKSPDSICKLLSKLQ